MRPGAGRLARPVDEQDHVLGPEEAPVTLVEYGDFECPYCRMAHPVVQELLRQMGGRMRYVFRHFPLAQVHPHAQLAAEASEAAGAQGRFWEMHDLLYEQGVEILRLVDPSAIARELGIDVEGFVLDLEARRFEQKVRDQFLSGVRSGVNGTPSFFINGTRHDGAWDIEALTEAVESAMSESEPAPAW